MQTEALHSYIEQWLTLIVTTTTTTTTTQELQ